MSTIWCNAQELIVPAPQHAIATKGEFVFTTKTVIYLTNSDQQQAAAEMIRLMRNSALLTLNTVDKQPRKNAVCYQFNPSLPKEGYILEITPQLIRIEASDHAGYHYATQSLLQLLPVDIFAEKSNNIQKWSVPALQIKDAPRFSYRGFMLDVSRFFMPKDKILKVLDYMSLHKLNKFHWHLVDDNGWRLEIKRYPRLTSVGASRVEREQFFSLRPAPLQGEPTVDNGFYTQEDVKEVVAYAAERCIEIIPEIEMPAHSNAALAAYPELACPVVDHFIGTLPGANGRNASAVFCAGEEQVFDFLQNILDEVITLFPSSYIHIGGDEVDKSNWQACSKCQQRMKDNNIPNEAELQSYFIRRINTYLQSKDKKLMGWDELVDSELPENATIFGWRGKGTNAAKAAQQGHPVVLTPARIFYINRYQGPQWFEPYTSFGNNTLADVYKYEIADSDITPELQPYVLGLQASLWTEFIYSWENMQYMVFPRLAALAENAWSSQPKDWQGFLKRLDHLTRIYDVKGIAYATSMYNLNHKVEPRDGRLYASVSCIRPDVEIRYTTTGEYPNATSSLYTGEMGLKEGDHFQAATFQKGERKGTVLQLNTLFNKATGARVISPHPNSYVLTNGLLGSERYSDGEYLEIYDNDIDFILDLGRITDFSAIKIGMMVNAGMRACLPGEILLEVSDDNKHYRALSNKQTDESAFAIPFQRTTITIDNFEPTACRYIRIKLINPGKYPTGHQLEGSSTRMALDEVMIE